MRWTEFSCTDIIRVNVFTKNWRFYSFIVSFPFIWSAFQWVSQRIWTWWEFVIIKVWLIKIFYSWSIALQWSDNISCWMLDWILMSTVVLISNFLAFSQISRSVKWVSVNFNSFPIFCFWLFIMFWLINLNLFHNETLLWRL